MAQHILCPELEGACKLATEKISAFLNAVNLIGASALDDSTQGAGKAIITIRHS